MTISRRRPRGGRIERYPENTYISSIPFVRSHREIDGERSLGPGRRTRSRQLTTNGGASLSPPLSLSFFYSLVFFILLYKTYFSRWFDAGFVALSPRTTTRSTFLLAAGLLALKSDAIASLFRPVFGADDLAGVGAAVAGSAGFALKFALIVRD